MISGTNFDWIAADGGAPMGFYVSIGGTNAQYTVDSDTQITATTPRRQASGITGP